MEARRTVEDAERRGTDAAGLATLRGLLAQLEAHGELQWAVARGIAAARRQDLDGAQAALRSALALAGAAGLSERQAAEVRASLEALEGPAAQLRDPEAG